KGDLERAISDLSRAIALNPKFAGYLVARGDAYLARSDFDHAVADFDRALALAPEHRRAQELKRNALASKAELGSASAPPPSANGDKERAFAAYSRAIELNARDWSALNNRAILSLGRGNYDAALADIERAIPIAPGEMMAHLLTSRGSAYAKKGQTDRALAEYDRALAISLQKKQLPQALADLDIAAKAAPRDVNVRLQRGSLLALTGQHERALADFDQALSIKPNNAAAYAGRGLVYRAKGDLPRALAEYDRAVAADERFAGGYAGRGRVLLTQKQIDKALIEFDRALVQDGKNADALAGRGLALLAKGRAAEANTDFERALENNPN